MKQVFAGFWLFLLCLACSLPPARAAMDNYPIARLRMLDKITARTSTFNVMVGTTVRFGQLYIKPRACRKAPPIEKPESASFLQIWEVTPKGEPQWVFSGWMFASSPALSSMDHPVYDVWVLDCLGETAVNPWPAPVLAPAGTGQVGFSSTATGGQVGFTSAATNGQVGFTSSGANSQVNFSSVTPQPAPPAQTPPGSGEVHGTVTTPAPPAAEDTEEDLNHREDGAVPEANPPPAPPPSKSDEVSPDAIHDPVY